MTDHPYRRTKTFALAGVMFAAGALFILTQRELWSWDPDQYAQTRSVVDPIVLVVAAAIALVIAWLVAWAGRRDQAALQAELIRYQQQLSDLQDSVDRLTEATTHDPRSSS